MNIDVKILANRINSTLKGSYTMIKWDLSQGCKDSPIYANQCDTPYLQNEGKKTYDQLNRCKNST